MIFIFYGCDYCTKNLKWLKILLAKQQFKKQTPNIKHIKKQNFAKLSQLVRTSDLVETT